MNRAACFLCCLECDSYSTGNDEYCCKCERCGHFCISRTASVDKSLEGDWRLMAATRQAHEAGERLDLHTGNIDAVRRAHQGTTVSTKIRKVLEYVGRHTTPGSQWKMALNLDYPLFDARGEVEAAFLLRYCGALEYLEGTEQSVRLTVKGWGFLEPETTGIPGLAFVAMSFDQSLEMAYDSGIRAAIEDDCGLTSRRVDRVHHNEKICDKIMAEIRLAQFIVADFTLQRAGVYFEAGFATGLGRPVIWSCREDDFGNLHFDTRQYNHIKWKDPQDLRDQLADRIRATIPGSLKPSVS